jgi:hypothetical protein
MRNDGEKVFENIEDATSEGYEYSSHTNRK